MTFFLTHQTPSKALSGTVHKILNGGFCRGGSGDKRCRGGNVTEAILEAVSAKRVRVKGCMAAEGAVKALGAELTALTAEAEAEAMAA